MPESTLTLTSLRASMRYRLGDPNSYYWTDAFLSRAIHKALAEFSSRFNLSWATASITTTTPHNTPTALPARFYKVDAVFWGTERELYPVDDFEMRSRQREIGGVGATYEYSIQDEKSIQFWDAPNVASTFTLWYFQTVISDPILGTFPLPDEAVECAMELAYSEAYMKEGETQNLRLASEYSRRFEQEVNTMAGRVGQPSGMRTMVMGGGYPVQHSAIPRPVLPSNFGTVIRRGVRSWR